MNMMFDLVYCSGSVSGYPQTNANYFDKLVSFRFRLMKTENVTLKTK